MPKALRRGLILLLSLALLAGSSLAQAASPAFTDLADVPWAVPGITALQQQGVLLGLAPGVFGPSAPVSRAQMATVLGRLLGWQPASGNATTTFQDAATIPAYALPYVATAAQDGIILGLPGGLFAPYVNVTWAQLAVIAARAYTYPQVLGNQIPPLLAQLAAGTATPAWAVEAVAQDVQAGDFSGVLADLYQPDQPVTRAELAAFLLQVEQSKGGTAAPVSGSVAAGQVTAVSASNVTVGDRTLPIAASASVYVGSAPSNLSAVQVGDTVSVVISGGQAILINVTATPSSSPATTLTGTVASLSTTQLGLTVTGQSTTVQLPLGATVTVTLNGAASALSAVQAGEQATVSLDASGNVSGIAITNTGPVTATGTVDSVSATEIVLTPAGGAQASYPLATDVTVNGLTGNLAAVAQGATVTLTLSGGQVTAIQTGAAAAALAVATTSLPAGALGVPYSATLTATGGTGTYAWTSAGSLPAGLAFTSGGVLSGTPGAVGSFTIPVEVQDGSGATATASLTLTVTATAGALSITTSTLPAATEYQPYSQTLQAVGGSGGDIWSYGGTLPAGLTLSTAGVLSGTPDATGSFSIVPEVRDSAGDTASVALTLTVNRGSTALAIATSSLPAATLGQLYSTNLSATGGAGGYTWQYSGPIPPGLALMMSGQLTGTPTAAGTYTINAIVTDSAGATASASLTLTVASATSPLAITTTSLPAATVNVAYTATLTATGGAGGDFWTYTNGAPGLSLSQSGVLSWTPTAAGIYYLTVIVRDGAGDSASEALTLTVSSAGTSSAVSVTTSTLPAGTVGQAYTAQLSATGGSGSYTWGYSSTGSLPNGLTLSPSGAITGTPTAAGTYTFSVQAVDTQAGSVSQARQLSITVAP